MSYEAPYQGYKVIDLSQGLAGPYCGMLLALNGAESLCLAPALGEHTREILSEFGYGDEEIKNLNQKSIIRVQ